MKTEGNDYMSKKIQHTKPTGDLLIEELSHLIEQSPRQVAVAANSSLTLLFWQVGKRINEHILHIKEQPKDNEELQKKLKNNCTFIS